MKIKLSGRKKKRGGEWRKRKKSSSVKVNVCLDVGCPRVSDTNEYEKKFQKQDGIWPVSSMFLVEEKKRKLVGREGRMKKKDGIKEVNRLLYSFQ